MQPGTSTFCESIPAESRITEIPGPQKLVKHKIFALGPNSCGVPYPGMPADSRVTENMEFENRSDFPKLLLSGCLLGNQCFLSGRGRLMYCTPYHQIKESTPQHKRVMPRTPERPPESARTLSIAAAQACRSSTLSQRSPWHRANKGVGIDSHAAALRRTAINRSCGRRSCGRAERRTPGG